MHYYTHARPSCLRFKRGTQAFQRHNVCVGAMRASPVRGAGAAFSRRSCVHCWRHQAGLLRSAPTAAPLQQRLYSSAPTAAPLQQRLYSSVPQQCLSAVPLQQCLSAVPLSSAPTAAPLQQRPYSSASTAAPLQQRPTAAPLQQRPTAAPLSSASQQCLSAVPLSSAPTAAPLQWPNVFLKTCTPLFSQKDRIVYIR